MYGAVSLRSRICGVLTNGDATGGGTSHATGFAPTHPGSGGGAGAPKSVLLRGAGSVPYGLLKSTCGTPVLWTRLSVKSGPPWHSMQPPFPWKSFSPAFAASDIVPSSNEVSGGLSVLMYAVSAAARRPASASQSADGVLHSPVTNSFMCPCTGRAIAAASVGTLPFQKYGGVLSRSHNAGGSRGPSKSLGGAGTGCGSRSLTAWSWTIVPSLALADPSAWQVWHVSPFSNSDGSRNILRP